MNSTILIFILIALGLIVGLSIAFAAKVILDEVAKEKPVNKPD